MNDIKTKLLGAGSVLAPAGVGLPGLPTGPGEEVRIVPPPPNAPKNLPRVMIGVPSGRTWEARSATAIAGISTFTALHGYTVGITCLEGSMITKQRNDMVKFAQMGKFDYLASFDSDMIWPPDTLVRLLKHDKDIVGATYNKRVKPYETLGKLKGEKPINAMQLGGLQEAELLPGGCMLVKIGVYEKMGWPWYWETYDWPGETGTDALKAYLRDSYASRPPEELLDELDGTDLAKWLDAMRGVTGGTGWNYFSEDLNFCRKARKNGFRLWCDLDLTYQGVHLGTLDVTCKKPEPPAAVVPAQM